jgi:predicted porin
MRIAVVSALCVASLSATQVAAQDWAVELYGGGSLESELGVNGSDVDVDTGTTYGAAVYYSGLGGMDKLELGVDASRTSADYDVSGDELRSTAVLAMARYTFVDAGAFKAYGSAGAGWVETASGGDSDSGLGGRAALGVRYDVNDQFGLFGEVRHTRAFESATLNGVSGVQNRDNSVVIGLRTQF